MKLYDFAFSPNCRKVRAVAYELGVSFEPVHVDLFRPTSVEAANSALFRARSAIGSKLGGAEPADIAATRPHTLSAIQLVTTRDGAIATVDHFMLPEVYPLFGVPSELPTS